MRHHALHGIVHRAVGPAQRQAGPEDGTQRRVDDGQQLEAHDECGDHEVKALRERVSVAVEWYLG